MKELDLDKTNHNSPYHVDSEVSTGLLKFSSDFGVSFSVAFEADELLQSGESYQFALTNYEGAKSPRDPKVRDTVMSIIDEFFRKKIRLPCYTSVKLATACRRCGVDCSVIGFQNMPSRMISCSFHK